MLELSLHDLNGNALFFPCKLADHGIAIKGFDYNDSPVTSSPREPANLDRLACKRAFYYPWLTANDNRMIKIIECNAEQDI